MISARALFDERLPAALERTAVAVAGTAGARILFHVAGEGGGRWLIDLRARTCRAEIDQDADCTVEVQASDLAEVLGGAVKVEDLLFTQRLSVTGAVDVAAHLPDLLARAVSPFSAVGLAPLVAPVTAETFLRSHWPDRHLVIHGPASRWDELRSLPELADVDTLLASWRGTVRVFPPGDKDYLSPQVSPDVARALYDRGFTLVFSCADLQILPLRDFVDALTRDLGLAPSVWGRSMIYANPPSLDPAQPALRAGLNAHFDENANFVVQLAGEKVWQIRPNDQVKWPTVSHLAGGPVHPELASITQGSLPTRMPEDAEVVRLRAGSFLYLPRAYWHQTISTAESLSLNFTFSQPTWADVVTSALRAKLARSEAWRGLAIGAISESGGWEPRGEEIGLLLASLAEEVRALAPEEIGRRLGAHVPSELDLLDLKRDWSALASFGYPAREAT